MLPKKLISPVSSYLNFINLRMLFITIKKKEKFVVIERGAGSNPAGGTFKIFINLKYLYW